MKERNENFIEIHGKKIYYSSSTKGWSIVIMPENILIDNYHHGFSHIHPDRKEIKTTELEPTLIIVLNHINKNKDVKYDELREELIK